MRRIALFFLFCSPVMFCACNQPAPTQPTYSGKVTLDGYGVVFDSSYYKVWSDSSWEEFYQDTAINGLTYVAILMSDSSEYLYDSSGYSGFKLPAIFGSSTVIFDSSLSSLPDTLSGGITYVSQTTFSFQGISYALIDQETLVDTGTVSTPFGTFERCLGIQSDQVIARGGVVVAGGDEVSWLAKGPSAVEQDLIDFGYSIVMAFGVVNDEGWGVSFPKLNADRMWSYGSAHVGPQASPTTPGASSIDIRSVARMILKGIIPRSKSRRF